MNLVTAQGAQDFLGQEQFANIPGYLGSSSTEGIGADGLLAVMDDLGVATGILCAGLDRSAEQALEVADAHPGRFLVAVGLTAADRPTRNVRRICARSPSTRVCRWCGSCRSTTRSRSTTRATIPSTASARSSGSRSASTSASRDRASAPACSTPSCSKGVLIDFPDLVVIGAHMGHPYEELLMNYMRKWPNLYLSCTAYAPQYLDPDLVAFMNSRTYRGRVLWGSDEPWFPMRRSLAEARALPLDDDAMALFLGGTARRLLDRTQP